MRASYKSDQALTVSSVAVSLTVPAGVSEAFVECQVAAVRYTLDGGAPTASVGHILEPGDTLELDSADQATRIQFIRRDGADATVYASYGVGD